MRRPECVRLLLLLTHLSSFIRDFFSSFLFPSSSLHLHDCTLKTGREIKKRRRRKKRKVCLWDGTARLMICRRRRGQKLWWCAWRNRRRSVPVVVSDAFFGRVIFWFKAEKKMGGQGDGWRQQSPGGCQSIKWTWRFCLVPRVFVGSSPALASFRLCGFLMRATDRTRTLASSYLSLSLALTLFRVRWRGLAHGACVLLLFLHESA